MGGVRLIVAAISAKVQLLSYLISPELNCKMVLNIVMHKENVLLCTIAHKTCTLGCLTLALFI